MILNKSRPLLNVVRLDGASIFQQLQGEEALLRADSRNWCLFNRGSSPAIVMGISGKPDRLIQLNKLRDRPIPLIRRFSGGGTVVVDENTWFVTLICGNDAVPISPFPKHLMNWSADLYRPLFPSHPFSLRENDYAFGEHKWGGNAQSIIKGRWIHHTSILWDYHEEHMEYLLPPPSTPVYRQGRSHKDFLCRLKNYWQNEESSFQNALLNEISKQFDIVETSKDEVAKVQLLPHRKATCLVEFDSH